MFWSLQLLTVGWHYRVNVWRSETDICCTIHTTFFTCLYAPDSVFPWTLSTLYGGLMVTLSNTTIFAPFHVMSWIVFEIAINNFCPSGDTPACRAITNLFFSSIWLRTLVFSLCRLRLCGGSFVVALTSRITWTLDTRDKFTTCTSFNEDLPLVDGHSEKLLLRKNLSSASSKSTVISIIAIWYHRTRAIQLSKWKSTSHAGCSFEVKFNLYQVKYIQNMRLLKKPYVYIYLFIVYFRITRFQS